MPARIGRLSAGVGRRHSVTIRKASLMARSTRRFEWDIIQERSDTIQERSILLLSGLGQGWQFAELLLQHPSHVQPAASRVRRMILTYCEVSRGVGDT